MLIWLSAAHKTAALWPEFTPLFIYKIEWASPSCRHPVADAICLFFYVSKQKITPVPIINVHIYAARAHHTNFIITCVRAAPDFWTKETDIGVRRRGMPQRLVTQTGLAKYYRAEKMSHHGLAGCCPRDGALSETLFCLAISAFSLCWPCIVNQLKIHFWGFNFVFEIATLMQC